MRAAASLAIWHLTLSAQFCGPRAISLICFKSGLESVIATGKHLYAWCCSCFCCRILSYWKGEEVSEALAFSFTEKIVCCASFMIWLRTTSSYWRCISICIIHRSFWLIASLFLFRYLWSLPFQLLFRHCFIQRGNHTILCSDLSLVSISPHPTNRPTKPTQHSHQITTPFKHVLLPNYPSQKRPPR